MDITILTFYVIIMFFPLVWWRKASTKRSLAVSQFEFSGLLASGWLIWLW